jgi:hypothetical protein
VRPGRALRAMALRSHRPCPRMCLLRLEGRGLVKRIALIVGVVGAFALGTAVAFGAAGGKTSTTTTTSASSTTKEAPKVWLCHHTGSWKHPYHLIHVSADASPAHLRHGDVQPGSGNSCPTAQPAGAKTHGKSGQAHGKSTVTHAKHAKNPKSADDDDKDDEAPHAAKP